MTSRSVPNLAGFKTSSRTYTAYLGVARQASISLSEGVSLKGDYPKMDYRKPLFSCLFAAVLLLSTGSLKTVSAQTAPPLGTAQNFAVLGASTVTNASAGTVLTGNLGVWPGSAITGFPPGVVIGTIHAADGIAQTAQQDALTAYNYLAGEACTTNLTGTDLGGLTLLPGVYCFNNSAQLTGTLTLNSTGNPNSVFVFKIASTLTTASNSAVVVEGGSACNVYFQVGTSATIGTGTQILGSIFAESSITITTSANVTGGSYALTGAVTMDDNSVTACMGTLQVCKVAGSSSLLGESFGFSIAGTPATLISVTAGASPGGLCSVALLVPAHPAIITETIPVNTTLAAVTTLPTPGLLSSSNLAAGTATVQVNPGGQTIATFVDTVPPPPATGFLQICKIAGSGITVGTNFSFAVAGGTPVTVPAGAAPGGSCGAAQVVLAGPVTITETVPGGTVLTAVSTLPSGLLVSSNLAAGTATVTVTAAGQTIVTFLNAAVPVIPPTGFLQICKVAGAGIAVGTNFSFSIAGTPAIPVTVPAGTAPGGSCSPALVVPPGAALITETLPANTALTSVTTLPAGSLVSSNLAAGTATATVTAGGQTIVTFLDAAVPVVPTTGFLQICKVAGSGITVGTNFSFAVAGGTPVTVPAGAAPGGTCSAAQVVTAGTTLITETLPANTTLTSVSTLPAGLLAASNLAAGTATVTVNAGGQTIVTFLDAAVPTAPATGFLQICKVAGSGITVGTNFSFAVAGGTPVTVPAGVAPGGSCSAAQVVPAGPTLITETVPAGIVLTSVSTLPSGLLVSSNLAAGTATVTVNAGGQTIVTFLNAAVPVIPTTGFLQICKVAGAGIVVGTPFSFSVAGTPAIPVTVPAGTAPGGSCSPALVVPPGTTLITETLPAGTALTSVTTLPAGLLVSSNLPAGTAAVTVNAGGQTIVTFLNTSPTGTLKICKIAGSGVPAGGMFTFVVAGASLTVPAGVAPGTCSAALVFPIGTAVPITENVSSGTIPSAISVVPAGAGSNINVAAGSVTATIGAGETDVTFTNSAGGVGLLKVCKVAGTGVAPVTMFGFVMNGTAFSVPAGYCVSRGTFPVGTVFTITENVSSAGRVSAISIAPTGAGTYSISARSATVTVAVGTTEVTFTNVKP